MRVFVGAALLAAWTVLAAVPAFAQDGRVTAVSRASFQKVVEALQQAITEQKMALVCHANAQAGAAGRGVTIKGN